MFAWAVLVVLNPTVTLTAGPMPASAWVKELSKATGTTFTVAGSVRDDVIFTGVKDVPLEELKRRVAEVVKGEWRKAGGGFELVRTSQTEAAQEQAEQAGRLKQIESALKKARELAAQPLDAEALARDAASLTRSEVANYTAMQRMGERSAISRLLYRLFGALDAKVLASLGEEERLVFAERPTRRQQPLGPGTRAAIDDYVREQAQWAETAKREKVGMPSYGIMVGSPHARLKREPAPTRYFLDVRLTVMATDLSVNLYFVGESGPEVVAQFNPRMEAYQRVQRLFEGGEAPEDRMRVPFGPVSQALLDWMKGFMPDREFAPLQRSAIGAIIQPERDDPLRWVVGDLLSAMTTDANVVAYVPERSLLCALAASARQQPTRGAMIAVLAESGLWKIDREEGWTLVRPSEPVQDRRLRVGRRDLGEFLRAGARNGTIKMRDHAKYMARTNCGWNEDIGFVFAAAIDPSFISSSSSNDPTALSLYGSLPDSQLSESEDTMEWRFSSLNPLTRVLLERAVYSALIDSAETGPNAGRRWKGERLEPTIAYPNGLPATGVLSIEKTHDEVLVEYRRTGERWTPLRASSPYQIASQVAEPDRTLSVFAGQTWAMTRRNHVRLRSTLAEGVWQEWLLTEIEVDPNVKPVDWTQIPRIKEEVEEAIASIREQMKDSVKPPI